MVTLFNTTILLLMYIIFLLNNFKMYNTGKLQVIQVYLRIIKNMKA